MSNYKNWQDIKKEIEADFVEEDFMEIEFEKQIIKILLNI